jgi:hypothetical protein
LQGSQFFEDGFELVELVHDVDVAGVDVEFQLFRLIDIGVETCSLSLGPIRRQGKAVHHPGKPIKLDIVFVYIQ